MTSALNAVFAGRRGGGRSGGEHEDNEGGGGWESEERRGEAAEVVMLGELAIIDQGFLAGLELVLVYKRGDESDGRAAEYEAEEKDGREEEGEEEVELEEADEGPDGCSPRASVEAAVRARGRDEDDERSILRSGELSLVETLTVGGSDRKGGRAGQQNSRSTFGFAIVSSTASFPLPGPLFTPSGPSRHLPVGHSNFSLLLQLSPGMFKRLAKKRDRDEEDEASGMKEIKAILNMGGEDEISGESDSDSDDDEDDDSSDDGEDGDEGEEGEDGGELNFPTFPSRPLTLSSLPALTLIALSFALAEEGSDAEDDDESMEDDDEAGDVEQAEFDSQSSSSPPPPSFRARRTFLEFLTAPCMAKLVLRSSFSPNTDSSQQDCLFTSLPRPFQPRLPGLHPLPREGAQEPADDRLAHDLQGQSRRCLLVNLNRSRELS